MSDQSEYKIATADALTLLLHNQHALGAAIEEVTKWLSENGVGGVAANAMSAMETLGINVQAITDSIMRLCQSLYDPSQRADIGGHRTLGHPHL